MGRALFIILALCLLARVFWLNHPVPPPAPPVCFGGSGAMSGVTITGSTFNGKPLDCESGR